MWKWLILSTLKRKWEKWIDKPVIIRIQTWLELMKLHFKQSWCCDIIVRLWSLPSFTLQLDTLTKVRNLLKGGKKQSARQVMINPSGLLAKACNEMPLIKDELKINYIKISGLTLYHNSSAPTMKLKCKAHVKGWIHCTKLRLSPKLMHTIYTENS